MTETTPEQDRAVTDADDAAARARAKRAKDSMRLAEEAIRPIDLCVSLGGVLISHEDLDRIKQVICLMLEMARVDVTLPAYRDPYAALDDAAEKEPR